MGADLFSIFGIKNIAEWLTHWLRGYKIGIELAQTNSPGSLEDFNIDQEPAIRFGFVGYTVQQYIAKSKEGVRRPTKAYENLLKMIPSAVDDALGVFSAKSVNPTTVHLGDVPHMYSLVPLAQSVNAPIRELSSKDGLVGSQFKQAEKYAKDLQGIASNLAKNVGLRTK
jgi:hypothetical protein